MKIPNNNGMFCFVIGNGTSREFFDLNTLDCYGITIGCNNIYKTYQPDYLVAIDRMISVNVGKYIAEGNPRKWRWIGRAWDAEKDRIAILLEGQPIYAMEKINRGANNQSGVIATWFAAEILQCPIVFMIGIDFFQPVPGRKSNDLLSSTTLASPVLHRVWNSLIACYPNTRFIRVGQIHERDRAFYDKKLNGFEFMGYEAMQAILAAESLEKTKVFDTAQTLCV